MGLLLFGSGFLAFAVDEKRSDEKDDNLYNSFGKRDPFRVPDLSGLGAKEVVSDPVRKYRLEGYRLRAILRFGGKPQAMFEDPEGKSHVVMEGDRIGLEGARVSRIINSEVIVTERSANYLGKETLLEKVISLPAADGKGNPEDPAGVVQQGFSGGTVRIPSNMNSPGAMDSGMPMVPSVSPQAVPTAPVPGGQ